jgi:hypothetical protein
MNFKEIVYGDGEWIELEQLNVQWWVFGNMLLDLLFHKNGIS